MSTLIHVRSKDCVEISEGFNTNLQIDLSAFVTRGEHERIHLSLSSAEIPVSWYAFSTNLLTNEIYVDGIPSIILDQGNYDIYEITALVTAGPSPFDLSFNINTGKCTFTSTTINSRTLNFSQATSRGLAKALGFERIDALVGGFGSVTGQSVVNLQTIHSIFLYTNLSVTNIITTQHGNYESIVDKIPVLVGPGDILHFDPYQSAPFSSVLSDTILRSFQLSLRDQNGVLVQLNGARYELSLLVEVLAEVTGELSDQNKRRREPPVRPVYPPVQPQYQPPVQPVQYQPPVQPPAQPPVQPVQLVQPPVQSSQIPPLQPYRPPLQPLNPPSSFQGTRESDLSAALMMAKVLDLKRI